jgi:hypothetical protein
VARQSAFAPGCLRLLARPLVRGALLVRGAAAFAGNLTLFISIHRCEPAILDSHEISTLVECNLTSTPVCAKNNEKFNRSSTDGRALSGSAV